MPKHVGDMFEGNHAGEASGKGVAKGVSTSRDAAWELHVDLEEPAVDDPGKGARGREGAKGRTRSKENLIVRCGVPTSGAEVSEEAVADLWDEMLGYGFTVLNGSKIYQAVNPIDVVKTEQSGLDASDAICREQENDSEVA